MLRNIAELSSLVFSMFILFFASSSCTKNFEKYNTNPNALPAEHINYDNVFLGGFFKQMEESIFPVGGTGSNSTNAYQLIENLCGDIFSGYHGQTHNWNAAGDNTTYNFTAVSWNSAAFDSYYSDIVKNYDTIQKYASNNLDILAVAKIIKVFAAHRVVDMYGPIPYFTTNTDGSAGGGAVYDPLDKIYYSFFSEIDSAISVLKPFASLGAKPLADFDPVFLGDYNLWIKFANSLKLRLATRIVYVDPLKAKEYGEAAVNDEYGIIRDNSENAILRGINNVKYNNPLSALTNDYQEARMGATMEVILKGLRDPRMQAYFYPSELPGDISNNFKGIRLGIIISDGGKYQPFSRLRSDFDVIWMTASEMDFLMAEGALRGWNLGATAEEFYEEGIRKSFNQWGVSGVESYLTDDDSKAINYVDPVKPTNNYSGEQISSITIKWDKSSSFEQQLERIITQKWIAIYPNGQEAWSEFRRTGFPKIIPVDKNLGDDPRLNSPTYQVKRLPYPSSEYQLNLTNVEQGVLLLGGADLAGTKLWWDKKS